jgi:hypothetical protein
MCTEERNIVRMDVLGGRKYSLEEVHAWSGMGRKFLIFIGRSAYLDATGRIYVCIYVYVCIHIHRGRKEVLWKEFVVY